MRRRRYSWCARLLDDAQNLEGGTLTGFRSALHTGFADAEVFAREVGTGAVSCSSAARTVAI